MIFPIKALQLRVESLHCVLCVAMVLFIMLGIGSRVQVVRGHILMKHVLDIVIEVKCVWFVCLVFGDVIGPLLVVDVFYEPSMLQDLYFITGLLCN